MVRLDESHPHLASPYILLPYVVWWIRELCWEDLIRQCPLLNKVLWKICHWYFSVVLCVYIFFIWKRFTFTYEDLKSQPFTVWHRHSQVPTSHGCRRRPKTSIFSPPSCTSDFKFRSSLFYLRWLVSAFGLDLPLFLQSILSLKVKELHICFSHFPLHEHWRIILLNETKVLGESIFVTSVLCCTYVKVKTCNSWMAAFSFAGDQWECWTH